MTVFVVVATTTGLSPHGGGMGGAGRRSTDPFWVALGNMVVSLVRRPRKTSSASSPSTAGVMAVTVTLRFSPNSSTVMACFLFHTCVWFGHHARHAGHAGCDPQLTFTRRQAGRAPWLVSTLLVADGHLGCELLLEALHQFSAVDRHLVLLFDQCVCVVGVGAV